MYFLKLTAKYSLHLSSSDVIISVLKFYLIIHKEKEKSKYLNSLYVFLGELRFNRRIK